MKSKGTAKKKRGKLALKIISAFLAVLAAFIGVTTAVTAAGLKANLKKAESFPAAEAAQLKLENYGSGCWNIYTDGSLKVLQLTDVHLGGGWMSLKKDAMSMNAVAAMITAENPDFVIVTGDIAYPVPFQAGTFNNKSGARLFAELMESLGVYWTLGFGNHDTEAYSYYDREEICDFYSSGSYPHCLLQAGPDDVDGFGNQVFNVVNGDGIITRTLYVLDSHSYVDGDILGIQWKYDNIHENQVQWYRDAVNEINLQNKNAAEKLGAEKAALYKNADGVPSSAFFHIPLTEHRDAWNEYVNNGRKDTENVRFNYGVAGESGPVVYPGIHNDELFETMLELGSTDSVFFGHDHFNNFSLNYKGINMTYGMSVDYLAYTGIYKLGAQRGCTVIDYAADGTVAFRSENYYQDKYVSYYEKEIVEDM